MRNFLLKSMSLLLVSVISAVPLISQLAINVERPPKVSGICTPEWSNDDKLIAIGGDVSLLRMYDANTFPLHHAYKLQSMIKGLSWHPAGNVLAIA